jgi:Sulfotransferase family
MFIGMNRSGSSLVGSLLNAHRHVLIAHELNALHFVRRRFSRNQLYWLLREQDQAFENADRQWYGYNYRVAGQWQGRCKRILVIGDKHAGGATHILGRRPELVSRLMGLVGVPVKMVHVVRNPLDNIATVHRLQSLSFEAAADYYFEHTATNGRLMRKYASDVITIHLEDVIRQPADAIRQVCDFLGLDAPEDYLQSCGQLVFREPRRTRDAFAWPAQLLADICRRTASVDFLDRYVADIARLASSPSQPSLLAA